jgi:hypothetical protein
VIAFPTLNQITKFQISIGNVPKHGVLHILFRKNCYLLASVMYELSFFSASCSDDSTQKGDKATTLPIIIRVGETRSAEWTSSTRSFNIANTYSRGNIQHGKI